MVYSFKKKKTLFISDSLISGNIAVHIFSRKAREKYDLESLWCLGREFDPRSNQENDLISLLEKHSLSLADLKAIDELESNK